jgi:hypothetical protein
MRQYAAGTINRHDFAKEATRLTKYEVVERVGQNGDHYFEQSTEHPIAHKEVAVDANIKEMAVAHHADKVDKGTSVAAEVKAEKPIPEQAAPEKVSIVPEVAAEQGTLIQALKSFGYSKEEFMGNLKSMRADLFARESKSFIYTTEARDFLENKIGGELFGKQEHYKSALDHGFKLDDADLTQIIALIKAEELYKSGQAGWVDGLSKALLSEDDSKVMQLFSAAHKNHTTHPILTNNSHAVRIWDSAKKKDVFWYAESATFNLDKKGNLIMSEASGQRIVDKQEIIRLAKK